MPKQNKKQEFVFTHPCKSKKNDRFATLMFDYIEMWLAYNGFCMEYDHSSAADKELFQSTLIIDENCFENIMQFWNDELYYLFPNASMWTQPFKE